MSIEIGSVSDSDKLTDYDLMNGALRDNSKNKKEQEQERERQNSYTDMEGALIILETTTLALEEARYLSERERKLKAHHFGRIQEEQKKAQDKIDYLLKRSFEGAIKAWREYEELTPEKRRRVYGQRYSIEVLLGYRKEWEL